MKAVDFARAPLLAIWETTRACALACRHCRAEARPDRLPGELDFFEGQALLEEIASMGTPLVVLSGGDPLERPDLEDLISHGKRQGLRMATIPAATPRLTYSRVQSLKDAGLDQIALSLDAPSSTEHDAFRGSPGAFIRAIEASGWARQAGLSLQINTCLAAWNLPFLEEMIALVESLGASSWELFFLVPTGRGAAMGTLTPVQHEQVFERLSALRAPFTLKVIEAPHYRRFLLERGMRPAMPRPIGPGNGFVFIDYQGDVYPSGFLPIKAGNVRADTLARIYRKTGLFRDVRDPGRLKGKCGDCEYKQDCGGSRSRAYAATGDPLQADPCCAYVPAAWRRRAQNVHA